MTESQMIYKKQLIQKIQITKHNVFSDDDQRREFLKSRFGVDSTTKLSIDELKLLLDFCNRKVSDIPLLQKVEDKENITQPQKAKIRALWNERARDKSEAALLNFAFKITKYKTTSLDNLLKGKATKLIIALEKMPTL
jgi:phage gp16-like protein